MGCYIFMDKFHVNEYFLIFVKNFYEIFWSHKDLKSDLHIKYLIRTIACFVKSNNTSFNFQLQQREFLRTRNVRVLNLVWCFRLLGRQVTPLTMIFFLDKIYTWPGCYMGRWALVVWMHLVNFLRGIIWKIISTCHSRQTIHVLLNGSNSSINKDLPII